MIIILPLSGALYQTIATSMDKFNYPPLGLLVDVGGYSLHIYCTGGGGSGASACWAARR